MVSPLVVFSAAMAILRQQGAFVEKLYTSGMVDEGEMHHMMDEISARQIKLAQKGPGWKQPTVSSIIRGLPFFKNIQEEAFLWIRRHSMCPPSPLLTFSSLFGRTIVFETGRQIGLFSC
jgi:hypothetical protein